MGTPYTQNGTLSGYSSGLGRAKSRKRTFDSLDDNLDENLWDLTSLTEDGRPKTRRVNPLRLAIRLGPDLVAEMEALIVPGAKMPSFTVRKDFQERYCVDRRHIYDYFHSRGLRVAKEDKHTNLIRGRAMKAQAQAQAQSASKPPSVTVKPDEGLPMQRPFLAKVTPSAGARGRVARQSKDQGLVRRPRLPPTSVIISSKRIKKSPSIEVPIETLPGRVSSESGIEASSLASSSGTDTDDHECTSPKFTITTELSDILPEKSNTITDFLQSSPDTYGSEYYSSPTETSTFPDLETAACGANLDMLMTVEDNRLLTQEERTELYNLIDNSMPQAYGIEESSGTYNLYMNDWSHSYFDPLLPSNLQVRPAKLGFQGNKMSKSPYEPSMDYLDVRKWLSEEIDPSDVGLESLDTHARHAFRNEFDASFGFSDILSSHDDTYGTISESTAHLHTRVQNQYSLETSIDINPVNNEKPNVLKKSKNNVESSDAQRHILSSLTPTYGRVRTTSARGGI